MTDHEIDQHAAMLQLHDQIFNEHVLEVDGLFHLNDIFQSLLGVNFNEYYVSYLWREYWKDYKFSFGR